MGNRQAEVFNYLFSRLGSSSGPCKPAVDTLRRLQAACRAFAMVGTSIEQQQVVGIAQWVHDARLGSKQQQQQLLGCLNGASHSLLFALSEVVAAGLKQLCAVDASAFLQENAAAMHHLGLLCVTLAAAVEFWCQYIAADVRAGNRQTQVNMITQVASSGD
jgi:hypothetical protein